MKKLFFILLLCARLINADAQAWIYHPMPDSNAVWRVDWYTGSVCPPMSLYYSYQYTIGGDTTIGIYSYKKIYVSGISGICINPNYGYGYVGAMRQDIPNKKVYFKCPSQFYHDTILYDFNLNVGDTIKHTVQCSPASGGIPGVVTSIDSVLVGSNYHKRFNCNNGTQIIEGVGSTAGLTEEVVTFEDNFYLICFSHDTDIYPSTFSTCPLITNTINVNELSNYNTIEISPNPATSSFTITSSSKIKSIKLFNVLGKEVISQLSLVNSQSTTIDISSFAKGIYFVEIITEQGTERKKIIKE